MPPSLRFLVALLLAAQAANAQSPPMRWGDVPLEHLEMLSYPADTNAAAVVLADYGSVTFRSDHNIVLEHHRRVKILTPAGYDMGTVALAYRHARKAESIVEVQGQTIMLGADGKQVRQKMNKSDIYEEKVSENVRRIRFTLPSLQPGAVIEYRYKLVSDNLIILPEWSFQEGEPVLHSEYRAELPSNFQYVRVTRGIDQFDVEEERVVNRDSGKATLYQYVMKNVPALREEPFMTTPADHRSRVGFQLARFVQAGHGSVNFIRSWDELAKELMSDEAFGKRLDRPAKIVRAQVKELISPSGSAVETMQAIYDYVRSNISWDGKRTYFLNQDIDDVLKTKKGNSAEIALLLVTMLREAELDAAPVLISTRKHGAIVDIYPLLDQFNHVLAHVVVDGNEHLLDATDPLRPHTLLPYEALNGRGWRVEKKGARWIPVSTASRDSRLVNVDLELLPDGNARGTISKESGQYAALRQRRSLQDTADDKKWVREDFLADMIEVEVSNFAIENKEDITKSLRVEATFDVAGHANSAGDFLYVNPILIDRVEDNPLRLEKRSFPVDFAYPAIHVYSLRMRIPEGYEVQELPSRINLTLSDNGGKLARTAEVIDGHLVYQLHFERRKSIYQPREYAGLREFYGMLVSAHADQIVLRRSASESTSLRTVD